jgi:hypothetical protein
MKVGSIVVIKPEILIESDGTLEGSQLFNQAKGTVVARNKANNQWTVKWDTKFTGDLPADRLLEVTQ